MKKSTLNLVMVLAISFCLIVSQTVFAKNKALPPGIEKKDSIPGKGSHKGWEQGKHKGWDKKREDNDKSKGKKKGNEKEKKEKKHKGKKEHDEDDKDK